MVREASSRRSIRRSRTMHAIPTMIANAAHSPTRRLQEAAAPSSCGFSVDCPLTYSLADINASAAEWDPFEPTWRREFRRRRDAAQFACLPHEHQSRFANRSVWTRRETTEQGGWCLKHNKPGQVELPNNESYSLPYPHIAAEQGLVDLLLSDELSRSTRVDQRLRINDFGAGVGQYGHALLSRDPRFRWRGFDGAGNVEAFTSGFVEWFDLTMPLSLPKSDWVLCLEVGEHVPNAFEAMVVRNLHAHNLRGLVLSWAVPNQTGTAHINNHRNGYIRRIFTGLGYVHNDRLATTLRHRAAWPHSLWLKHTIMVFERWVPLSG